MVRMPAVGSTFAGYRLDEEIGSGNMGTVFKAWNPRLHRHEALKVLAAPEPSDVADRMRNLFRDEARIAAALRAPNMISVLDGGEDDGLPWYTMTYVEGASLGEELASYPPRGYGVHEVIAIVHDLAQALDALSEMTPPVVHGDVKPSNIMVERSRGSFTSAILVDFGVATTAEAGSAGVGGRVAGSLPYMAPEILGSGRVSAAGDQYALACTAHELLAGAKAFPASDVAEARRRHGEPPPSTGYGVRVDRVLHRALAADPGKRWSTCSEFSDELGAALIGAETGRRKRRRIIGAALAVGVLSGIGAIAYAALPSDPMAVPFAEGSSLEYATLPDLPDSGAVNPNVAFPDERWRTIEGADSRFTDMTAPKEFSAAFRLVDQGIVPGFPVEADLYVYRHPAAEDGDLGGGGAGDGAGEGEREIRNRILSPLEPEVRVDRDVVKLLVPSIEKRLLVLQTSGTIGAGAGGEFCMIHPLAADGAEDPRQTPWFLVISTKDACTLVYDAIGEWVAMGE
ncbi:serine/threonine-protein kinase [Corynebacterium freneyi]